jgi:hypothetical protein
MGVSIQQQKLCLNSNSELSIEIGIASTKEERDEIFRLRYRIYVEEMLRQPFSADHRKKLLFDEFDPWAVLVYAKVGTEIIGTMRANIGAINDFPLDLVETLQMDRFYSYFKERSESLVSFGSKLMVLQRYRNSTATHQLLAKGYEIYCNHHVQFNFGGCNFYLLRFYEQMGYRRLGRGFVDPGYGLLHPFVLLVDDVQHLKLVRSPYFRIARKRSSTDSSSIQWFTKEFARDPAVMNSQLVTEDELWNFLRNRLGERPEDIIQAFQGIDAEILKKLLCRCSVIVQCYAGDKIVSSGLLSEELNIVLSGRVLSGDKMIFPGQHFGVVGIANSAIQMTDSISVISTEIIVISRQYFRKFSMAHPKEANQILTNLKNHF